MLKRPPPDEPYMDTHVIFSYYRSCLHELSCIIHVPALVVTVGLLKCNFQSDRRSLPDPLPSTPNLSVQQIKLASWPPEHTQHREGPRLRPGQIQFKQIFLFFPPLDQDSLVTLFFV